MNPSRYGLVILPDFPLANGNFKAWAKASNVQQIILKRALRRKCAEEILYERILSVGRIGKGVMGKKLKRRECSLLRF